MLVICTARIGQAHNRFAAMGLAGWQMLIDCCSNGMRRANVGSATLSAYVGGWLNTDFFLFCFSRLLEGVHGETDE